MLATESKSLMFVMNGSLIFTNRLVLRHIVCDDPLPFVWPSFVLNLGFSCIILFLICQHSLITEMLAIQSFFLSALFVVAGVFAVPTPSRFVLVRRQSGVSTLSSTQLSDLAPFTQFARAAYCGSSKVQNWQCGRTSGSSSYCQKN